MDRERRNDRLYPIAVIGFLVALVAAGLLGVPALLDAAGGALLAGLAIVLLRGRLEGRDVAPRGRVRRPASPSSPVARQYVPSVLEVGSPRRRHGVHLRRRHPRRPLSLR